MIKEFAFYHGASLAMLLHYGADSLRIEQYPSSDNSSYVVNNTIGVYIKYSTKRMSPWHFFFENKHKTELVKMASKYRLVVVMLVCRDDGVVGLTLNEFEQIAEISNDATQWISITRRPREKYSVKGTKGRLSYKIAMTDFCEKVLS